MSDEIDRDKLARFQHALDQLVARVAEDRYVLAVVTVGSLSEATIWKRETLSVWIIEADVSADDCAAMAMTSGSIASWLKTALTAMPN